VISARKYFDFVTSMMLVTGLVFELPLVVMGMAKIGVVTSRKLLGWWRYAFIGAFVVAAVVTPSVDPITQSLVAGPIIVLYFVGILLAKVVEGNPLIPRST
jgi:sec-independent protein translocase protein TatC